MKMAEEEAAKQFSFRLPGHLVNRVDECTEGLRAAGLDATRADAVRLLLKHALDSTRCDLDLLLDRKGRKKRRKRPE
jgi:Arc/MetJ-type ribon-helix-helix transcriptional regulator